jgi:hypothetical protein
VAHTLAGQHARGSSTTTSAAEPLNQMATADRDAFQRYVCHTWKRMSCQTPVIVGDRKPSGGARGTPSRRQVTHVPYDPSFEMPAEGGPNERLTGDSIPRRVTPS